MSVKISKKLKTQLKKTVTSTIAAVAVLVLVLVCINSNNTDTKFEVTTEATRGAFIGESSTVSVDKDYGLNYKNEFIKVNTTLQLEVIDPTDLTANFSEAEWSWSSSNPDVAEINSVGKVTGKTIGYTTITGVHTTGKKVRAIINVYRDKKGAVTYPQVGSEMTSTIVLKEDGTVWASGANGSGQLGDGTTANKDNPVQVKINGTTNLTRVKKISCGIDAAAALTVDGKVYTWGANANGKLGVGDTNIRTYATPVIKEDGTVLTDVIDIAMAEVNAMFITSDGSTYVTGNSSYNNFLGKFGNTSRAKLLHNNNAIKAASSYNDFGQMLANGDTLIWGCNDHGNMGVGYTSTSTGIQNIGNDIVYFVMGGWNEVLLKEDGSLWTVAHNAQGQFGNGTTSSSSVFVKTILPTDASGNDVKVKYIAEGPYSTQIMDSTGKVYGTGFNGNGALAQGNTTNLNRFTAMKNSDGTEVDDCLFIAEGPQSVSSGTNCTTYSIIKEDGSVWTSGTNAYGQIGDSTSTNRTLLTQFGGTIVELNAKNEYVKVGKVFDINVINRSGFNVFIRENGDHGTWTWSSSNPDVAMVNSKTGAIKALSIGQTVITGYGENDEKVKAVINVYRNKQGAVTYPQIGSEMDCTIILKEDGTVWSTGNNNTGQLGDGTTTAKRAPEQVKIDNDTFLTNVKKISCGINATAALTTDGRVYTWGENGYGKLGVGDKAAKVYATPVIKSDGSVLTDVIDIAMGEVNAMFITSDGSTYVTGCANYNNFLGRFGEAHTATYLRNNGAIKALSGYNDFGQMLSNGDTLIWGNNDHGNMGVGYTSTSTGVQNIGNSINSIIMHGWNETYLKEDGTLWTVAHNAQGQFGNGTTSSSSRFIQTILPKTASGEDVKVKYIAGGPYNLQIMDDNGKVYATGYNGNGSLSQGNTSNLSVFTTLKNSDGTDVDDCLFIAEGPQSVSSGPNCTTYAIIRNDGSVWVSGNNGSGQIGNGSTTSTRYLTRLGESTVNTNAKNEYIKIGETFDIQILASAGFNVFIPDTSEGDQNEWTWKSSNPDVATVNTDGRVTGVGIGYTTITGTNTNGDKMKAIFTVYRNKEGAITIPKVGSERFSTTILKEDGTVWATGLNNVGQLGDGTSTSRNMPVQVMINSSTYLTNVKKISCGIDATAALTTDGIAYTWGHNDYGKLGVGDTTNRFYATPVIKVDGTILTDIIDIAMGETGAMFITRDGSTYVTGQSEYNNFLGKFGNTSRAKFLHNNNAVRAISGYNDFGQMLANGDTVIWGNNDHGNMGVGNTNKTAPLQNLGKDIDDIVMHGWNTTLLKEDGSIWTVAHNAQGQFGNGTTSSSTVFIKTITPKDTSGNDVKIKYIAGGPYNTELMDSEGKVYAAGFNGNGQLSQGNATNLSTFTTLKNSDGTPVTDALFIAEGTQCISTGPDCTTYSIIREDGTVWTSGNNVNGEKGDGTNDSTTYLSQMGGVYLNYTKEDIVLEVGESYSINKSDITSQEFNVFIDTQAGAGDYTFTTEDANITVTANGKVTGLAEGFAKVKITNPVNNLSTYVLVKVVDGKNMDLEIGNQFSVGLTTSGQVWTWGSNIYGELGTGASKQSADEPEHVTSLENIVCIGAGYYHAVALDNQGKIYTWGLNNAGQLGNNSTTNENRPIQISILPNIKKVDAYKNMTTALDADGNLYIWGEGYSQQPQIVLTDVLDVSEDVIITKDRRVKRINQNVYAAGVRNAIKVSASDDKIIVLQADGTVKQIDNNNNPTTLAVTNAVEVSAGNGYTYILDKNGDVYTYGTATNGELGNGTNTAVTAPTKVAVSNIEILAAGEGKSGGVADFDGYMFTTGKNEYGQLGHGNQDDKKEFEVILNVGVTANVDKVVEKIGESEIVDIGLGINLNLKKDLKEGSTSTVTIVDDTIATLTKNLDGTYRVTGKSIGRTFLNATVIGNIRGEDKQFATNVEVRIVPEGGTTVPQIKSGQDFTVALKSNGEIESWGKNTYGQLGIGDTENYDEPQLLENIEETIVEIAVGDNHVLALTEEGTIYGWGLNNKGQVGNGTTANQLSQATVINIYGNELSKIIRIEAHGDNSFAINEDGEVYAWGKDFGNKAVKIENLENVIDVSTSHFVKADGTVYSYRKNDLGEIVTSKLTIVGKVRSMDEGIDHSVFLTTEGQIFAIGSNDYGQLGNGSTDVASDAVVAVRRDANNIFEGAIAVEAGDRYTMILTEDGDVYETGLNESGRLGLDKTTINVLIPVKNANISDAMLISAGNDHAVIAKTDGTAYAWGKGDLGALGNRRTKDSITPEMVGPYVIRANERHIVLGKTDEFILKAKTDYFNIISEPKIPMTSISKNTQVARISELPDTYLTLDEIAKGYSAYKVEGIKEGTTNIVLTESKTNSNGILQVEVLPVPGTTIAPMVETNSNHVVTLKTNGTVWTYGNNAYGQLGIGTLNNEDEPQQVIFNDGYIENSGNNELKPVIIKQVISGEFHSVALDTEGNVWTWGRNNYYQLGVTNVEYSTSPIKVTGIPKVTRIACGNNSVMAITENNKLVVWGQNAYGELGTGAYSNKILPTEVNGMHDVLDIQGGKNHYLILKTTGELYAIGSNLYNQLGIDLGERTRTNSFEKIEINPKFGFISSEHSSNVAITIDGAPYIWGQNTIGNMGGANQNTKIPTQIQGLTGIVEADVGKTNTILRDYNNNIYIVGQNKYGQIGNGTTTDVSTYSISSAIDDVLRVSTGNTYTLVMKKDGTVWAWGDYNHGSKTLKSRTNSKVPIQIGSDTSSLDKLEIVIKKSEIASIMANSEYMFNLIYEDLNSTSNFAYESLNTAVATVNEDGNILGVREGSTWVKATDLETGKVNVAIVRVIDNVEGYNVYAAPKIRTGDNFTVALKEDGNIDLWGYDISQMVDSDLPYTINVVETYVDISAGKNHMVALRKDGTVWTAGDNIYGQLGIGSNVSTTKLVQIQGLSDIEKIAAGDNFGVAMDSYGIIYVWGQGYGTSPQILNTNIREASYLSAGANDQIILVLPSGQIYGFGSILNGILDGIENAVKVEVEDDYLLILDTNGDVYIYRNNTLAKESLVSRAIDISIAGDTKMYQNVNEKAYGWGDNSYDQLGVDSTTYQSTAIPAQPVNNGDEVFTIGAGKRNTYIVDTHGFVYSAGDNSLGQIGNGTKEDTTASSYGRALTHTIVGGRDFKIEPEETIMEVNDIENLKIKGNTYNVFEKQKEKNASEFNFASTDNTIVEVLEESGEPTGSIKALVPGLTTIDITDKVTSKTKTITRKVVPLDQNRILKITADGNEAVGSTPSDETAFVFGYKADIPMDDDQELVQLSITTKDAADSISIDELAEVNKEFSPNGILQKQITFTGDTMVIPVTVKTSNGTEFAYELTLNRVSNNNEITQVTVNGFEATKSETEEDVYEIIITDLENNEVKVTANSESAKVSINGKIAEDREQTYTAILKNGYLEVPFKVTSESGKIRNAWLRIYTEDTMLGLRIVTVNDTVAEKQEDGTYKSIIADNTSRSKVKATASNSDANIGINDSEKELKQTTKTVITTLDETTVKIKLEKQAVVDGVDKLITKEYDLKIYKNKVFTMLQEVQVNGEVLEEENNTYRAYVLSNVTDANIIITAKDPDYKITFGENENRGILTLTRELPDSENTFTFIVENDEGDKQEYTIIIERGSTDTKLQKITVGDGNYVVEAEKTDEKIGDIPVYEAKILDTHNNVDVTAQTANKASKVEINNSGNLCVRIAVENMDLNDKTTLVPITVKTADEATSKDYYLRIIKANDDNSLERAFVNELLSNPDIEAAVDLYDEIHYEVKLENPVNLVQLTAIATNEFAKVCIGEEEPQTQTATADIEITSSITEVEIKVISEAGTEKTYTITIYTISDDTTLESVKVNGLDAVWNRTRNRYEIKVDRDLLGYEVVPITTNVNAKVAIDGTEGIHTITKQVTNESEETIVNIKVTAENAITSDIRKLAIIEKSDNKELGYVKVNGKAIAHDDSGNYHVEVGSAVKSVLIEVGAQDSNATVNLDGDGMTGVWKNTKTLATDDEVYDVYIVAEDGRTTSDTFKIFIARLDGNTNIDSITVTYKRGSTDVTEAPEQIDESTYYLKIPRVQDNKVGLSVVLEQAISRINILGSEGQGNISGNISLTGEITIVPIVVTAEDGTRKEVSLVLEKESIDTSLKLLKVEDYPIEKNGDRYVVEVDSRVDEMYLTAIPNNENARVRIVDDYEEYQSKLEDEEVDIVNQEEMQIEVIAEDGVTTKRYTIEIIRKYNTSLKAVTLNGEEPVFGDIVNVVDTTEDTAELFVNTKNYDAEIYIMKDDVEIAAGVETLTTNIDIDEEAVYTYIITVRGPDEFSDIEHDYVLKVRKKSTNNEATIKLDNEDMAYNDGLEQYETSVIGGNHTLDVIAGSTYSTVEIEAVNRTTMQVLIEPGATKVYTIKVTSETGAEKTYKVQIYRKNNDTDIKEVKIKLTEDGAVETLTALPDGSYYKKINRNQESVYVTLTANDVNATVDIDGASDTDTITSEVLVDPNEEITLVPLKIIAEDGTQRTVNLKLEKESNDATLKELKYKGLVVLKQAEHGDEYEDEYTIEVDNRFTEIKIDATPTNANAKLKVVGNPTYLSTFSDETVDIEGKDYFEIEVIAEDGETIKLYKVNIRRIFNTEVEDVKVDTDEEVTHVLKDYSAFVSPTADNHTVQVKPSNELAVITFYDEDDNLLNTGTGTTTLTDSFAEESKTYKVKVQGPTGFEEFSTDYTVTVTKRSRDTSASIYVNNTLVTKDEETGKYRYITKVSNNTLKIETTSVYAKVSIDDKETKTHEASEIYVVNVNETKPIGAVVTSQNGGNEEYAIEIIRLDNNNSITNITVNGVNANKVTSEIYRNAQEKSIREARIVITPEYEYATVKAECEDGEFIDTGVLEFDVYLSGSGLKEITITVTAQDGSRREYMLNIVQNVSDNMNFEVKVNNLEADRVDDSSYKIFVENTDTQADVHLYAEDEFTIIESSAYNGNDIRFDKILNTENDVTIVTFTVTNELGNTNYYMLYIIKESNDYSIRKLYVNDLELTKGDDGRYRTYIENTAGDPTVKVKMNNEYAYVRIGTNERELQESTKVVPLSENRVTTIPITTYSQSGIANTEYLDIVTTFAIGRIDAVIIDDVEVTNYNEETRTYTALVENGILEHEIIVVADNNYVTLELEGYVGLGSVTSIVSFEEGQEIKEMTLYVTGETDLTETYTIIIAQKSNNVELAQIKVNDVTLQEQGNYIYRKNIDLGAKKVKVEATTKYPYATVKVGDHETKVGESGVSWIDIEVTQDEITIPVVVVAADGHTLQTYNIILTRKASTMTGSIITDNYDGKHNANIYVYRTNDLRDIDDPDDPRELIYSTVSNDDGSYVLETPNADTYDIIIKKTSYLTYTITNVQAEAYSNVYVQTVKIKAGDIDKTGEIELDDLVEFNDHIGEEVTDSNKFYDLNEDGVIDIKDRKLIKANYHSKAQTVKWKNPNEVDLIKPLDEGYTLTSDYGYRVDPIDGSTSFHSGVDLFGPHHGNVYAVADGEVTWAGVQSSYGNCVEIKHIVNGETIYSFYAHMSRIDIEVGDLVEQGDVIGLEGGDQVLDANPGRTTGHHLHFEMRSASGWTNHVDPHDYLEF